MNEKKIGFLFGAGISIPYNYPSTQEITDRVMSGEGFVKHSNSVYVRGNYRYKQFGFREEYIYRTTSLIKLIYNFLEDFYKKRYVHNINYEDLYYIIEQIQDSIFEEYDNPAIQPLIDLLQPEINALLIKRDRELKDHWRIEELFMDCCDYIHDVVSSMLNLPLTNNNKFSSIVDAIKDEGTSKIDIFTLNHDLLLEQTLKANNLNFTDGFGKEVNEVRYWKSNLYETEENKTRIFKLHGSINWYQFSIYKKTIREFHIGIHTGNDLEHTKSPFGDDQILMPPRSIMLLGRFNKIYKYSIGIFKDIHCIFYKSLKSKNVIIVSGYSFGDKTINSNLIDWIMSKKENRIILIHGNFIELKQNARPAISRNIDEWISKKKLIHVDKWIQDVSWDEIKKLI